MKVLIGIDDTDNESSPGTGQLARRISAEIERLGGTSTGITRHQFLVDPRIPYTGHNRGICVGMEWGFSLEDLGFVFDLVRESSAEGSDPGVCIVAADGVDAEVVKWGERAMREVLGMEEAAAMAAGKGLRLRRLGGTGQGIIGAMGSVGLRAGGNEGRFVNMPGLRELGEFVTAEKLAAMGIEVEHRGVEGMSGEAEADSGRLVYKTLGWVRPRLSQGRAILTVEWSKDDHAWVPVERKTAHAME